MRRGCISLGSIQCSDCQRVIAGNERYLCVEEQEGVTLCLCINCCLKRGYAGYKTERGESVLTFLESEPQP